MIQRLSQLQFVNNAYGFPVDTSNNNQPRQVTGFTFSEVQPEQKLNPRLIAQSKSAFELINVDLDESNSENVAILAGNIVPPTSKPVAHNYSGYQFGNWAGQLGDGRAILLGSVNGIEIQLKGAGLTPYSRTADGRAALRSSIREFLCSEAMYYLGIPTTRAAALILTDTTCVRDMFYDGHPKQEPAAVVIRMAQSFFRFGSFEGDAQVDLLKAATRNLLGTDDILTEITKRTAKLVAQWQNYGFCHGVLNTDNMSVVGVTIDYGPFAFMEYFDRQHICNHSDTDGRYSYENQPAVVQWNLVKLAQALKEDTQIVQTVFSVEYKRWYYSICLQKLRLINDVQEANAAQIQLVDSFYNTLHETNADMHKVFRILMNVQSTPDFEEYDFSPEDQLIIQQLTKATAPREVFLQKKKPKITAQQLLQYQDILKQPHIAMMLGVSQEFIEQQTKLFDNYKKWENVSEELRQNSLKALWTDWLNQYKQNKILNENISQQLNPQFILTNKLLQEVIEQAEGGDYSLLKQVQQGIEDPFNTKMIYICRDDVCVSCSS